MAKSTVKSTKAARPRKTPETIKIPKVPKTAFNKERPVSDLLWTQVEHLASVVTREIDVRRRAVRTEGDASAFIGKMTGILNSLNDQDR